MLTLSIAEDDKILIIAPHPDDECIGMGGLLLKYPQKCDVWVLTDGSHGKTDACSKSEIVSIRRKELDREMNIIGVNSYRVIGIEDATLSQHVNCLCSEDLSCYTKIFVPNKEDIHPDHRAAYIALRNAVKYQNRKNVEVYQYEVSAPLPAVTHMINLEEDIKKKIELISLHESQTKLFDYCGIALHLNALRAAAYGFRNSYIESYLLSDIFNEEQDDLITVMTAMQQKQIQIINIYDKWLEMELKGIHIPQLLFQMGYKKVAVYGYAKLGMRLVQQLKDNALVTVEYIIDMMASNKQKSDIDIIEPSLDMKEVDVIIVTVLHCYDEIKHNLECLGYKKVISLEDIFYKTI